MKIAILGTGQVAQKLSQLLAKAKHSVVLGSREPASKTNVENAFKEVKIQTYPEVIGVAEVIVLAFPYAAAHTVLPDLSPLLEGKIVIDATNPLQEDWSPLVLGAENSAGEEISRMLPEAKVVKAFNTIFADMMEADKLATQSITAFYAGDHAEANQTVGQLLQTMGFAPIEVGGLWNARYLEAMAHLNIQLAVGMQGGTGAAFHYVRS